jgi:hypothetical protein
VLKTKIELMAGVAIVGLVLLLLLSFGAEGRALRRAEHREKPADPRAVELLHQDGELKMTVDGQGERNR